MALTFTWVARNRDLQADIPVDHFAAGVAPPSGWKTVVEWRFRADAGDAWGAPTIQIHTPPTYTAEYTPPADGWVQITCYSTQDGLVSWDGLVHEFEASGGGLAEPEAYVDDADAPYVDDAADPYMDKD